MEHFTSPVILGSHEVAARAADLLRDESNLAAVPVDRVYLPETTEQVAQVLDQAKRRGATLAVGGARTGITGGSVPGPGDWVLSLSRMTGILGAGLDPITGQGWVRVQAGVSLADLDRVLAHAPPPELRPPSPGGSWAYPVDPTEWSASVGGTVATNASGARSFRFGATGAWVRALTVVLPDGRVREVRRSQVRAAEGILDWSDGVGRIELPALPRPRSKSVAGYDVWDDVDLVDLLVGSEGTLGVISEVELSLQPRLDSILALFTFLPPGSDALALSRELRDDDSFRPLTLEYLGPEALDLLRAERMAGAGGEAIPSSPHEAASGLFMEFAPEGEAALGDLVEGLDEVLRAFGGDLDSTWAGDDPEEGRRMRALRHAVPDAVNRRVSLARLQVPGIHKVGTDLSVPDDAAEEMDGVYRERLSAAGIPFVLFGHAAENHLHANLIPGNRAELEQALEIHQELAREAVRLGGSVTAEHGIGRLKRNLLTIQFGEDGVARLRSVKDAFDPDGILNPGVLFPPRP